ncbi:MAG: DUF4190 domain-containing protein [Actinomycetota bacterium]
MGDSSKHLPGGQPGQVDTADPGEILRPAVQVPSEGAGRQDSAGEKRAAQGEAGAPAGHGGYHIHPPYARYPASYRRKKTDDLAAASLICAVGSFVILPVLPAIAAVVLGHMARERISWSEGTLEGNGLALAGIIVGIANLVLVLLLILLLVFLAVSSYTAVLAPWLYSC